MFHLVTVVIGIALTALVVSGGVSYMHGDVGVRRETTERVTMSYRTFDAAVSAYRVSNQGAVPSPPLGNGQNQAWKSQMSTYFPPSVRQWDAGGNALGPFAAPVNMEWSYAVRTDGRPYVCLSTRDGQVSKAVHEGLAMAATRAADAVMAKRCGASDSDLDYDGAIALTFYLQAGG